ncbi:MAG: glutamine-hydrolyzing GMP synthase [Candidatus Aenigmarchaeota archaeon]|nr:glutamine-hydrolyzing GMP synthase [Candidatus Aenigmarchaeota archaeon]
MPGIAVLDSGGQYCHLIARKIRELGVYSEILPIDVSAQRLKEFGGIIISGGPHSVYEHNAPQIKADVFKLQKPVLGICYGHQLITQMLGGEVKAGKRKEYGIANIRIMESDSIFSGLSKNEQIWMSHGDSVTKLPAGFRTLGGTEDCKNAAVADFERRIYGLQFHPEVTHTTRGTTILENFLFKICKAKQNWDPAGLGEKIIAQIRQVAKGRKVYFLVSGGVDSTVAYTLCSRALPHESLEGLYVDTGFMRKNESVDLRNMFRKLGLPNMRIIDASSKFLNALGDVVDPEEKRNRIGKLFFEIQEEIVEGLESKSKNWVLGQGTIYPDTIESGGTSASAVIKTHHNRVPAILKLEKEKRLVEPLRELYKDEVRKLGCSLGLPKSLTDRHPFPGPGLAIRVLCAEEGATARTHRKLRRIAKAVGYSSCILSVRSVGVQGDSRSYSNVAVIGGNAADLTAISKISTNITNQCIDINRVIFCLDKSVVVGDLRIHKAFLTEERLNLLRETDATVHKILGDRDLMLDVWQFPVVLIPVSRASSNGESIVLRPVCSINGMTAEFSKLPLPVIREMEKEILKLDGVDLVFFDVSNKPPATIEWE